MASEWERIARIRATLGGGAVDPRVLVGIGDDCAVLAPASEPLVWTIDAAVEGVHFRRDLLSWRDVGYRSTMAAASDLAAMGAAPLGLLAALVLPAGLDEAAIDAIAAGQREAADALGAAVIGGNLARGGELSITTTALGTTPRPLTRAGAKVGDGIWMAGPVGLAAAGFALLSGGHLDAPEAAPATEDEAEAKRAAVEAWRRPRARIAEGLRARGAATAAIDVSDGLAQDVGHMARASGLRAVLDEGAVVGALLRDAAFVLDREAVELALHGGEDYALVIALPEGAEVEGFARIGRFEARSEPGADVWLRTSAGEIEAVVERGFDHFARG